MAGKLPFVYVNVAMTADGKIAPANRHFVPFSTPHDRELMMDLRSRADAVLSGARTVEQPGVSLGTGGRKWREQRLKRGLGEFNLRVIASGSASIPTNSDIFKKRFSPILLLTTEAAPASRLKKVRGVVDDCFISPGADLDFRRAFEWLREKWNVRRLLCEGGGELNEPLFHHGLVDELYLTICPVIFGGRNAPTLADGEGVERLADASRFRLKRWERIGDEVYCVFKALRLAGVSAGSRARSESAKLPGGPGPARARARSGARRGKAGRD